MTIVSELTVKKKEGISPPYAWVVVFVTLLAGLAAPLNQFKVPPVMPVLMEEYALDLTTAGVLMSIFAITGLVLALPTGILLHKWGARTTGLIAVGSTLTGAVLGAFSTEINLLLISRLIEGIGMGLIAVVGPAVINMWFPPRKRGLPMGFWATWVPLGSLIIYNLAPWINNHLGWKMVWWVTAGITLVIFLLFMAFFRLPPAHRPDDELQDQDEIQPSAFRQALRNPAIWLLALTFGCYNLVVNGVIATFYPTFLKTVQGVSLADASSITSIKMGVCIFLAPFVGLITDRVGSPVKIIMLAMFSLMIFMAFPFSLSGWQTSFAMLILGVIAACLATATFSSFAAITRPDRPIGITIAVVMIGQNLGQLIGPLIFGGLVEKAGWAPAGFWMIPVAALGLVSAWLIRTK